MSDRGERKTGEWIDVTRVLRDGMTGWPGDPPFRLRKVADFEPGGTRVSEICTSAHIGTHIDAPLHCLASGPDVAGLDLWRLCGPAVVVDLAGAETAADRLEKAGIRPGDRVLLRTQGSFDEFAGIGVDEARWLIERRASLLGVDCPSPDRRSEPDLPVHRLLLGAGVPILENLDLGRTPAGRYEMVALPLPIAGGEASPARVILRPLETRPDESSSAELRP